MQNSTIFPAQNPKATLLIVHGMAEHQNRYVEFANFLADNGIAVMTFDHLGHGTRNAPTATLGYMGEGEPHEAMLDDVKAHADKLANQYPALPHFILGHSMGSFLTRALLARFGNGFAGAILMGTSSPNPLNAPFVPVTRWFNRRSPTKPNEMLNAVLGKINNQPFAKESNLDGFNWLNSNPERVKEYIADPLCGFTFTNNGFYALMSLMAEGTGKNWADNVPKNLPMLFVSGEDDPVGQMGKGIPLIVKDLQAKNFADVTGKQYPKMRHEILLEDDKQMVYDDILTWISQHS